MNEIAHCIADHNYNAALNETNAENVDYSKIITADFPEPPYFFQIIAEEAFYSSLHLSKPNSDGANKVFKVPAKQQVIYDRVKQTLKTLAEKEFTEEKMLESPLGRYFLGQALLVKQKSDSALGVSNNSTIAYKNTTVFARPTVYKILNCLDCLQEFDIQGEKDIIHLNNLSDKLQEYKVTEFEKLFELLVYAAESSSDPEKAGPLHELLDDSRDKSVESRYLALFDEVKCTLIEQIKGLLPTFMAHSTLWVPYLRLSWYIHCRKAKKDDFITFRKLGKGAFGVVSGARNTFTGKMVALKALNRKVIKRKKCEKMVAAEKQVLELLGNKPSYFVVNLLFCFYDRCDIFMALPLLTGGDLSYHLGNIFDHFVDEISKQNVSQHDQEVFESEVFKSQQGFAVEVAIFFAAEILLGLLHLHSLGILYRDLKPENVLLDEEGHVKISDLGLAIMTKVPSEVNRKTVKKGRAGTPGYWPPEMIEGVEYGFEADWWSFGCTLYELFYGLNPFSEKLTGMDSRNHGTLNHKITCGALLLPGKDSIHEKLGFDVVKGEGFEPILQDLLDKLLMKERNKRLGTFVNPKKVLMEHELFKTVNFEKLTSRKMRPPWAPSKDSTNAEDLNEIESRKTDHAAREKLSEKDNEWVNEHLYVSKFTHEKELVTVLKLKASNKLSHLDNLRAKSSICCIV